MFQIAGATLRKRFGPIIGVISAIFLVICWSLASPPGSSPDEAYHLGNSWCAFGESNTCGLSDKSTNFYSLWAEVPFSIDECLVPENPTSVPCGSKDILTSQILPIDGSNAYPTFYYKFANVVLRIGPEIGIPLLRVINGVLAVIVFGLSIRIARGLAKAALLTSLLVLLVPQGLFIIASVNPSSWSFVGVPVTAFSLLILRHEEFRSENSTNQAKLLILLGLLMSTSRYDSLAYAIALCLLILLFDYPSRRKIQITTVFFAAVALVVLFIYSHRMIAYVVENFHRLLTHEDLASFSRYWLIHFLEIPLTSVGLNYGAHSPTGVKTPPLVGHIQFGFLVTAIFFSFVRYSPRQRLFLAVVTLTLYLVILQQVSVDRETGFYMVQGRYFLPFLVGGLTVLVLFSQSERQLVEVESLRSIIIGTLTVSHLLTFFVFVRRFSNGFDVDYSYTEIDTPDNFNFPDGWRLTQFVSPATLIACGALSYLILLYALLGSIDSRKRLFDNVPTTGQI